MLPEGLWPLCPEGLWPAAKGTARARVWRLATRGRSRRTRLLRRSSTAPSPTRAHPRVRRPGFARAAWPPPLHGHTGRVRSGVSGSFVHVPATHRSIARGTRRLDRSTHGPQRRALSYSAAFRAVRWSTLPCFVAGRATERTSLVQHARAQRLAGRLRLLRRRLRCRLVRGTRPLQQLQSMYGLRGLRQRAQRVRCQNALPALSAQFTPVFERPALLRNVLDNWMRIG